MRRQPAQQVRIFRLLIDKAASCVSQHLHTAYDEQLGVWRKLCGCLHLCWCTHVFKSMLFLQMN